LSPPHLPSFPTRRSSDLATRLMANGAVEIHPLRKREAVVRVVEFDIPPATTGGGTLILEWQPDPNASGNGRFVQVSEVWLVKRRSEEHTSELQSQSNIVC